MVTGDRVVSLFTVLLTVCVHTINQNGDRIQRTGVEVLELSGRDVCYLFYLHVVFYLCCGQDMSIGWLVSVLGYVII